MAQEIDNSLLTRIAEALERLAKRDDVEVTTFLMGDGVTAAMAGQKTPDGYYKLDRMLAKRAQLFKTRRHRITADVVDEAA